MNDSNTVTATLDYDEDGTPVVRTSEGREVRPTTYRPRAAAMTDEEVEANALSDPDNPPLTAERLARMQPLPEATQIRLHLRLTQEQFAELFGISLGTLRDWEQERSQPDTTARTLLRVIAAAPDVVAEACGPPVRTNRPITCGPGTPPLPELTNPGRRRRCRRPGDPSLRR